MSAAQTWFGRSITRSRPGHRAEGCMARRAVSYGRYRYGPPRLPEPFGLSARTRSERVHLVAGWSDMGDSIRQLRRRHRQRIKGFAQQLDLTSLRHEVP